MILICTSLIISSAEHVLTWLLAICVSEKNLFNFAHFKLFFLMVTCMSCLYMLDINPLLIMASGPITSWEIDGETVETVSDFIFFLAPKSLQMVTAAML